MLPNNIMLGEFGHEVESRLGEVGLFAAHPVVLR